MTSTFGNGVANSDPRIKKGRGRVDAPMDQYLLDHGMTREEHDLFVDNHLKRHCIMGDDHDWTNEYRGMMDGSSGASGPVPGHDAIAKGYHRRYRLPVMPTQTNVDDGADGQAAVNRLWKHEPFARRRGGQARLYGYRVEQAHATTTLMQAADER